MSDYKLIKWYPGLPSHWKNNRPTVRLNGSFFFAYDGTAGIHKDIVMNHPEFWRELIDKTETNEYVVLSYKGDYTNNIYHRDNGGNYFTNDGIPCNEYADDISIYSIKRKSDGEVFTVGDKVGNKVASYNLIIDEIRFGKEAGNKDKIFLFQTKFKSVSLKNVKHLRAPLFTTEDGVDIYEGDGVFVVFKRLLLDSNTQKYADVLKKYKAGSSILEENLIIYPNHYIFSTKQKAEEYIEENKSQYSKSDIRKAFKPLPLGKEHCNLVIKQLERNE